MVVRSLQYNSTLQNDHKYLTSTYSSFNTVRYAISASTVQNFDIPVRENHATHIYLAFVRSCELNYKQSNLNFVNNYYLIPNHLKRMRLFNNIVTPPVLYEGFDINNINMRFFDTSMHAYSEYLVDNYLINDKDKFNFFCETHMEQKRSDADQSVQRNELMFICPVSLIPLQKAMNKRGNYEFNINLGAISSAALSLCLEFTATPSTDNYLLVTYQSIHCAQYNTRESSDQSVKFSPKVLYK